MKIKNCLKYLFLTFSFILAAINGTYADNSNKLYDIIFADPPYNYNLLNELTSKASNRLNKDGIFVLESSPREFSTTPFKVKVYGDTQLTFWKNF